MRECDLGSLYPKAVKNNVNRSGYHFTREVSQVTALHPLSSYDMRYLYTYSGRLPYGASHHYGIVDARFKRTIQLSIVLVVV